MTRKMDQLREGKRGFQARTDLGMPMYSSGRSTAGISRGTGLVLLAAAAAAGAAAALLVIEELEAVADEQVDGVADVVDVVVVDNVDGGGVELILPKADSRDAARFDLYLE